MIFSQISSDTIATSCGIEIKSPSPVLGLCRRLIAEGCDPTTPLEAYRGDTLCLTIRSIGEAAKLEVGGVGFIRAREPRPAPYSDYSALQGVRRHTPQNSTPSSLAMEGREAIGACGLGTGPGRLSPPMGKSRTEGTLVSFH